jgi:hypothetical protein
MHDGSIEDDDGKRYRLTKPGAVHEYEVESLGDGSVIGTFTLIAGPDGKLEPYGVNPIVKRVAMKALAIGVVPFLH